MKKILMLTIIFTACSAAEDSINNIEREWLRSVKHTTWCPQEVIFDPMGTKISYSDQIIHNYVFSQTTACGVYTSSIEFPPIKWYLYSLESSLLIRYGPFLYSNEINKDPSIQVTFTPKQSD
ncbi:MAG: hypothetical protein ACRCWI_03550 [Brevinema sp.]